jgi:hypothetical protein
MVMKMKKHLTLVKKTVFIFNSTNSTRGKKGISTEPTTSVTTTITATDSSVRPTTG